MFNDNIKRIREEKDLGVNELSRMSGVNASYISALERGEKENPTISTLEKLATALGVTIDQIFKSNQPTLYDLEKWDKKSNQLKEELELYETGEFQTPAAAMRFILKQPTIMKFGEYDIKNMSEEDLNEFTTESLRLIKLISYKYK